MKALQLMALFLFVFVGTRLPLQAQQAATAPESFQEMKVRAEKGDAKAQLALGNCYAAGDGVVKDSAEALKWYRKAADQNLAEAQYNLGGCYHKGEGVARDYVEAIKWFRKAAEQNYARAQCSLGVYYHDGQGVAKDYAEAVKWFRKAAEQNYASAQYNLGLLFAESCCRRCGRPVSGADMPYPSGNDLSNPTATGAGAAGPLWSHHELMKNSIIPEPSEILPPCKPQSACSAVEEVAYGCS